MHNALLPESFTSLLGVCYPPYDDPISSSRETAHILIEGSNLDVADEFTTIEYTNGFRRAWHTAGIVRMSVTDFLWLSDPARINLRDKDLEDF